MRVFHAAAAITGVAIAFAVVMYIAYSGDTLPSPTPQPVPSGVQLPARRVEFRSDLFNLRPVRLDGVEVEDERTLILHFLGGVEECFGVHHADVKYGGEAITVTLFQGDIPRPTPEVVDGRSIPYVCILLGIASEVQLPLDEPLGDRIVVDGAAQDDA